MSPRHQSSEASLSAPASSTASNACRLAGMSETTATFIRQEPSYRSLRSSRDVELWVASGALWPLARCRSAGTRRAARTSRAHGTPLLVGFPGLGAAVLGQILDALAGAPLRVVVLHRVDQLAHEARREVHARYDHARHLL